MKIVFLARMAMLFTGKTVYEKALGGSESALLYMARELAALGHAITIINNCGKNEGKYEGVNYKKFTTMKDVVIYSQKQDIDIFIFFRDPQALLSPIKAKKKVWWGHDDFSPLWHHPFPLNLLGYLFGHLAGLLARNRADKFFVVSNWLKRILMKCTGIPKEKIYVTRNGVHFPYFEDKNIKREKHRLIFSSVPWRGLDTLLDLFPKIKKEVPQAELFIYAGLDLGVLSKTHRKKAQAILKKTQQPGVRLMGTRNHHDLAQELQKSRLFLYPNHPASFAGFYAETSCLSALEAQAAGTPVIASGRGALTETVVNGETGKLIAGNPYSKKHHDEFAQATIDLLKDEAQWETMNKKAKKHIGENYSWKKIAQEWVEEFKKL